MKTLRKLIFLFLLLLIAGTLYLTRKPLYAPSPEALRVTNPALYQEWVNQNFLLPEKNAVDAVPLPAIPNFPNPQLYPLTLQLYELISAKPLPSIEAQKNYTLTPPLTPDSSLDMVFIPGGTFTMGSPESEPQRGKDESPTRTVELSPFWISSIEIPWEIYQRFMDNGKPRAKDGTLLESNPADDLSDLISQPTASYTAMNLGMGNGYERGFPAIAMSHYAAAKFCEWLSAQTGDYYRLPTEAEWEYACRAGTPTAYSFGNDEAELEDHAWFYDNGQDQYQRTKTKKPNPLGLYDMHGNVAEWVLDTYAPYPTSTETIKDPVTLELEDKALHIVRGGSWDDDPPALRSAARRKSSPSWNAKDPQNPKSIWYLTDGGHVGFRIVRPLSPPPPEKMHLYWNASKGKS